MPVFESFPLRLGIIVMLTLGLSVWCSTGPATAASEVGTAPVITLTAPFDPVTGSLSLHTTHPNIGEWIAALVPTEQAEIASDGSGGWAGAHLWSGNISVSNIGDDLGLETGGTDGETYTLFIQQFIPNHPASNTLKIENYVEDTQPPVVQITQFSTQGTSANLRISTSESDDRLYVVVTDNSLPVSKVQLRQGLDGANAPALFAQQFELSSTQEQTINLSELTVGGPYFAAAYQVDDRGLESDVVQVASTDAPADFVEGFDDYPNGTALVDTSDWVTLRTNTDLQGQHQTQNGTVVVSPLPGSGTHVLLTQTVREFAFDRFAEVTLSTVPSGGSDFLYLVVRSIDENNYYFAEIKSDSIRLGDRVDGAFSNSAIKNTPTFASGDVVRLEYQSGTMRLFVNSVLTGEHTPTPLSGGAGFVGFGNYMKAAQGGAGITAFTAGDLF